jgi:Phage integrase family
MSKLISKCNEVTSPAKALPHARLHDLRRLHATTLLTARVPVHVVAARLGHADPAVTLRIYSHVLREHTLGVGDVFAQAVRPTLSRRLLANPLANRTSRDEAPSVCAGEWWWSGAGSNRRPSAFQAHPPRRCMLLSVA